MKKVMLVILFVATCLFSQDYFPLKTGNRWDFKCYLYQYPNPPVNLPPYSIKVLTDSVFKNQKKYFHITNINQFFSQSYQRYDTSWIRVENGLVFKKDLQNTNEKVIINFNMSLWDTLIINHNPFQVVKLISDNPRPFLGILSNCLEYYVDLGIDNTRKICFSKKLGIAWGSEDYLPDSRISYIVGCKINDTVYGTLLGTGDDYSDKKHFELNQNYPNPFNSSTKINYEIPLRPPLLKGKGAAGEFVSLKIYDILGREIETLVDEVKPAGKYSVEWNAGKLSSGVYIYTLRTTGFSATKKLILLR